MIVREIAPLNFVVCGAPSYLAERGTPATPADLLGHNCLRLRGRGPVARSSPWRLGSGKHAVSQQVSGNFLARDLPTLVTAAVQGQGLVFAPLPLVLPLLRANALWPVLTDYVAQPARLFIHYATRKHVPARVKVFVDFMLGHLRANPDLISDPQELLAPFAVLPTIAARTPDGRARKATVRRR